MLLTAVLLPVFLATIVGAIMLWPSRDPVTVTVPVTVGATQIMQARVTALIPEGTSDDVVTSPGVTHRVPARLSPVSATLESEADSRRVSFLGLD